MTREAFVRKWRVHLAGLALFGVASEVKDGPLARAAKVLEIPAEAERLLGMMFDDMTKEGAANGNGKVATKREG
jgi:hypothetical protein